MLKIYLAGAIRNDHPEDIEWRERMITMLNHSNHYSFINPLGGKTYDAKTGLWTMAGGFYPTAKGIKEHDFYGVDHANIIVFNFLSLAEGYPSIGTLTEFGRSTARPCLRYSIVQDGYCGHSNAGMYKVHPFLAENSAYIFPSVDECIKFMQHELPVLDGSKPHFFGDYAHALRDPR
jgi:hypothetical protein